MSKSQSFRDQRVDRSDLPFLMNKCWLFEIDKEMWPSFGMCRERVTRVGVQRNGAYMRKEQLSRAVVNIVLRRLDNPLPRKINEKRFLREKQTCGIYPSLQCSVENSRRTLFDLHSGTLYKESHFLSRGNLCLHTRPKRKYIYMSNHLVMRRVCELWLPRP